MKIAKYFSVLLLSVTFASCGEDFLTDRSSQTVTPDQIAEEAKKDPENALGSQVNGLYTNWNFNIVLNSDNIMGHMNTGFSGIMQLGDVMSNDVSLSLGNGDPWAFDHTLDYYQEQYVRARQPWLFFYTIIKGANEIIPLVSDDSPSVAAKALKAQALAFRGISYAYLAQFYQRTYVGNEDMPGVILILSDDEPRLNDDEAAVVTSGKRATLRQVYARAEHDLLEAIDLFDGWKRSSNTQIDQSVAQGLLSRVYLVMGKYAEAAQMANAARQGYSLMTPDEAYDYNYQDIDNKETMWGCDITDNTTRVYASFASWMCSDYYGYGGEVGCFRLIDAALYNSLSDDDARKFLFVAPGQKYTGQGGWEIPAYANLKFKVVDNWLADVIYMRAAEMYLTEAEGLYRSGDRDGAQRVIREYMASRVFDYQHQTMTAEDIYTQRRAELWGEGFGYFDCRRLKKDLIRIYDGTNEPAATQINVPFDDYRWTYQIPLSEIQNNENITEEDQNPLVNPKRGDETEETTPANVRRKQSVANTSRILSKK